VLKKETLENYGKRVEESRGIMSNRVQDIKTSGQGMHNISKVQLGDQELATARNA
jgi:hypothetical protein